MARILNIAFQGGTHGNFLRYIIDRFSALTPNISDLPFKKLGTSHKKINYSNKVKRYHPNCSHPYFKNENEPHVFITIEKDDIVFIERWITIRANNLGIDTNKDNIQFTEYFFKDFKWKNTLQTLYNIKDLLVPRSVLRDFYKKSFLNIQNNGLIKFDTQFRQYLPKNTFCFPVSAFWKKELFFQTLQNLNIKFDLKLSNINETVYNKFIEQLYWIKTKNRVFDIIEAIKNGKNISLKGIDTVEQAFISAWIEKENKFITIPFSNYFFQTTNEIQRWLKNYPTHYKAMNPNLPTFNGIPNPFYLWNLKK
jgi:hypothetical protein